MPKIINATEPGFELTGGMLVPLIRLIFSALLAICAATMPAYGHAADKLLAGHPEETLALNSPLTEEPAPEWLSQ